MPPLASRPTQAFPSSYSSDQFRWDPGRRRALQQHNRRLRGTLPSVLECSRDPSLSTNSTRDPLSLHSELPVSSGTVSSPSGRALGGAALAPLSTTTTASQGECEGQGLGGAICHEGRAGFMTGYSLPSLGVGCCFSLKPQGILSKADQHGHSPGG